MRYLTVFLLVFLYSFKIQEKESNLEIIQLLQDENILPKALLCKYIDNKTVNKYTFKSTGDYIELKKYQIGIIEGENRKEVIKIALIFKDSSLVENSKIKALKKNGNIEFFIGDIYTAEENNCPKIVQIKYVPIRIDTLQMKFDIRMAKEKSRIEKEYCN